MARHKELEFAKAKLAAHGYLIKKTGFDNEYRVYPKGTKDPELGYFTDDLDDAIATGIAMAQKGGTTMRASRQQHLPGIEPGVGPIEIVIPTMGWEQIGGDQDPGTYGGTIATADGDHIELIKIQPVRENVGDNEAKDVGFPFWTRTAWFDVDDIDPKKDDVRSALDSIGMSLETLEEDFTPEQRAIVIAEALLDHGHADEGPSGWSDDINIPEKVKWWSGKVAGAEYLADEDDAFGDDVLGYGEIKTALEEEVERLADESSAQAWSTAGDQLTSDIEDEGFDPESVLIEANFGDAKAINGDSLVGPHWADIIGVKYNDLWSEIGTDKITDWLDKNGYEYLDRMGGRVPSEEGFAQGETAIDAVAENLDRSREDVEKAAKSLDWWQEEIPRETSGHTYVWAKKKSGTTEERRRPIVRAFGREAAGEYHTQSGIVGAKIHRSVDRDGRVTYSYTGKWGAGSGLSAADMQRNVRDWLERKRGIQVITPFQP